MNYELCTVYAQGNEFVFSYIRLKNQEILYRNAYNSIYDYISKTTNINISPAYRTVTLSEDDTFKTPFLYLSGDGKMMFSEQEKSSLKKFLQGGGLLIVDDASGRLNSAFDRSIRQLFLDILPFNPLTKLPPAAPIYRSFYLIKKLSGLYDTSNSMEGIYLNNRLCVIYSRNNLLGVWDKDERGVWSNMPSPGGEPQRFEAIKLMVNIIMYSVTGTYKLDRVHEPFIERKLKE